MCAVQIAPVDERASSGEDDDPPAYAAQQAMLARRGLPVTIPELDRAPRDLPSPYTDD